MAGRPIRPASIQTTKETTAFAAPIRQSHVHAAPLNSPASRNASARSSALTGVSVRAERGRGACAVGENGAGKSTLMNIVGGVLQPDGGEIEIEGAACQDPDPGGAQAAGIGLVHQEIALCPDISVAENIFMAETNTSAACGWTPGLRRRAEVVLADCTRCR